MTLKEARESIERELIESALQKHAGKIKPCAAELGVSRPTLYDLINKLGIGRALVPRGTPQPSTFNPHP